MTAEPVLVETSAGVVGVVLTSPPQPPRGAAVILPGVGSTRAGSNQMFVRIASSLAAAGVSSIRFDYPGTGESHFSPPRRWGETTREIIDWFRRTSGIAQVLLVADCSGVVAAHREVMSGRGVLGVAVVRPAFLGYWPRPSLRRRLRAVAGRVKRFPSTALLRLRYGPADPKIQTLWSKDELAGLARTGDLLVDLAERAPLWVLTADKDPATPVLGRLQDRLAGGVDYELEVLTGVVPGGPPRPGVAEIARSTALWAARRLGDVQACRTPISAGSGLWHEGVNAYQLRAPEGDSPRPAPTTRGDHANR